MWGIRRMKEGKKRGRKVRGVEEETANQVLTW